MDGNIKNEDEPCGSMIIFPMLYVDNILLIGNVVPNLLDCVKTRLAGASSGSDQPSMLRLRKREVKSEKDGSGDVDDVNDSSSSVAAPIILSSSSQRCITSFFSFLRTRSRPSNREIRDSEVLWSAVEATLGQRFIGVLVEAWAVEAQADQLYLVWLKLGRSNLRVGQLKLGTAWAEVGLESRNYGLTELQAHWRLGTTEQEEMDESSPWTVGDSDESKTGLG
ncbi:hypothetical protein CRG98_027972 [Punica granatum]|uniref:Uncharacterized protein n=1 Tax=Punica granatum TaxID=22663 RepID=A0A2I0J705_PUNGR|nr:hypothetical protein CRG98_027972 [Punica granatum]